MKELRKVSREYYLKQIMACWMILSMAVLMPVQIAMAVPPIEHGPIPTTEGVLGDGFVHGAGVIEQITNRLTDVTVQTQASIIHWNSLDTVGGEQLNYMQDGVAGAAVLNRVTSGVGTEFLGHLSAETGMSIFMVNPAGILFGVGSTVNVTNLVASSLDIADGDFVNGIYKFAGGGIGEVANYGHISAEHVALIGGKVLNAGVIEVPAGTVVMAAGDSVFLGQPGSKIIIEMSSATGDIDGIGSVTNEGSITASEGKIILAAGDIYSIPLHPQLQAGAIEDRDYDYAVTADKAVIDLQPIRVETGNGTVTQSGIIHADGVVGDGGSVILTAGDDVVLAAGSLTTANAGVSGAGANGGEVVAYAYDFGDKENTTTDFQTGAVIQVGGYDPSDQGFTGGLADVSGNHVFFNGSVPIEFEVDDPLNLPDGKVLLNMQGGTVQIDPVTLTIAENIPVAGAAMDTFYKSQIEMYSQAGVNLDLAGDTLVTVEYMSDGILGGTGNIGLRTVFVSGGINFLANPGNGLRTAIITKGGGDIHMVAGSGGILTGDLRAEGEGGNSVGDPGQILLLTDDGGGAHIETGELYVGSGNNEIISLISSGNITINGDLTAYGQEVADSQDKTATAEICLIAAGSVDIAGDIKATTHGKDFNLVKVHVDAGSTITIDGSILAKSNTSGNPEGKTSAESIVEIHAGADDVMDGDVVIEEAIDITGGIDARAHIKGSEFKADSSGDAGDNVDKDGGYSGSDAEYDVGTGVLLDGQHILIQIENKYDILGCDGCPVPPLLPPVPVIFFIADDLFEDVSWRSGNVTGYNPEELDVLQNDNGIKFDAIVTDETATAFGGILQKVLLTDDQGATYYWGYKYTPPTDIDFEWDGSSEYASFTDTFTYRAEKDGKSSVNTATVTIIVKNILPVPRDGSDTIHMSTAGNPTSADFELDLLVVDIDGSPDSLVFDLGSQPGNGGATLNGAVATYNPDNGYVSPTGQPDSFEYTVSDSSIVTIDETTPVFNETISIDVTNAGPTAVSDTASEHMTNSIDTTVISDLGDAHDAADGGVLDPLTIKVDGVVLVDGDTFTTDKGTVKLVKTGDSYSFEYTADEGETGPDTFDYMVSDGELDGSGDPIFVSATVDITLTNEGPSAVSDTASEHMTNSVDTTIISDLGDAHDDADGGVLDPLTIKVDGNVLVDGDTFDTDKGTVKLVKTGDAYSFEYTADEGETGPDTFDYMVSDGELDGDGEPIFVSATVDILLTNELPTAGGANETGHMNIALDGSVVFSDTPDTAAGDATDPLTVTVTSNPIHGTVSFDPVTGTFVYTPTDAGYVGPDSFTYTVSDGQLDAPPAEGTVNLTLTNTLPEGGGWYGNVDVSSTTTQDDLDYGFYFTDADKDSLGNFLDTHSVVPGTYIGSKGGILTYHDDGTWTYAAPEGYLGDGVDDWFGSGYDKGLNPDEHFAVKIWDGQMDYSDRMTYSIGSEIDYPEGPVPVYGRGTVYADTHDKELPPPNPFVPAAPLARFELPRIEGCPELMLAVAAELGTTADTIQIGIGNALALNPSIQACQACATLVDAAAILRDEDGSRMAAMVQMFNELAPAAAPFTPATAASIAMAFEAAAEGSQYDSVMEYIDAFAQYVAVLDIELGSPVGDSVAFVMEKHGAGVMGSDNANIGAFVAMRLEAAGQ